MRGEGRRRGVGGERMLRGGGRAARLFTSAPTAAATACRRPRWRRRARCYSPPTRGPCRGPPPTRRWSSAGGRSRVRGYCRRCRRRAAWASSATDATDDPSRRSRACKTFASPLRALAPLLLRGEDPALVEIVVEQRRRQRVASQKCRLVLRDGIDRTTRDIEAFRTQKTAAPWLMRPTGTAT